MKAYKMKEEEIESIYSYFIILFVVYFIFFIFFKLFRLQFFLIFFTLLDSTYCCFHLPFIAPTTISSSSFWVVCLLRQRTVVYFYIRNRWTHDQFQGANNSNFPKVNQCVMCPAKSSVERSKLTQYLGWCA